MEAGVKLEIRNPKLEEWFVREDGSNRHFDLEERTFEFAARVRKFAREVPQDIPNKEDLRQLIRSSGSVGANYLEAGDALGRKDFLLHIKISRKEAKESRYWLRLLWLDLRPDLEEMRSELAQEAFELMRIFGAICRNKEQEGQYP